MKTAISRIVLSTLCLTVFLASHNAQAFSTVWEKEFVTGYINCPNWPQGCWRAETLTSWSNTEEAIGYFVYVWVLASHANDEVEDEFFGVTAEQPNNSVHGVHYPCFSGNWNYYANAWLWYFGPNYDPTISVSDVESRTHNMPDVWTVCSH